VILDTSALVAILVGEEDGDELLEALVSATAPKISAATLVEAGIVLDIRTSPQQRRRLDDLLGAAGVEVVPFDARQAEVARQAYTDFGRGSGHPARLNLGDTFAYALHRVTGEPMLFKGQDFAAAGVERAG
jgi:ribonuclease VapC